MATASMHVQEPPRLAGALRAKQRGAFLDLPHLMAARPQAAAAARARRARSGGDNCFSWAQFAGGNTAKDAAAVAARENHHKLLKLVAEMLGGEASSQELHGAAQLVFDVLSAAGRSPADRRAELVAGIGFIEQEAFKAAVSLVNELQTWRASVSGEPDVQRAAHKDSCAQAPASQAPESQRAAVCEVRRDRAIDWARDLDSLPLYDSDAEEDTDGHDSGAAGASEGHCAGAEGDPVEFLEARLCQHCAALGLPADAVVEDVFRCLSSARGMDEVQSVLCDLVGFEALDLIGDLLQARTSIAVHVSQQRMARLSADASAADLAAPAAIGGFSVTTAANQQLMKQMKKDERRRRKQEADPEEDGWLKLQGFNPAELRAKREAELAAGPQSSSRGPTTFDGSVAGFAGAAKLSLPTGTRRILHDKENYEEILVPPQTKAPVRGHERRIPTNEFSAFCQPAFEGIPELNRVQSIVYPVAYKTGNNMLVCAPTGAGKTECAMMTVLHCLEQHLDRGVLKSDEFKIVYVAPMKALASEVTDKFSKRLGRLGLVVKELTGDMKLSRREITDTHMLVVTPEKWDVMTRKSSDAALTSLVKLLIIDEIHLLNEDRGAVLEAIVARTLRQVERSQSMIRIVGLSATLPTYKDVAVFLRVNVDRDLFYFDNAYRPVPLETAFIGVTGNNQNKQRATMLDVTYKKVLERVRAGHQVMVFVHSRKDTYKTARTLMEMAQQEGTIADLDPSNHPRYGHWEKIVAKSRNKEIRELFAAGLSCHHAGILRSDRNMVEKLFAEGVVKVLLCTATLAWGVNLPAHSVIIKGTQVYDPKKGSFVELGVLDVMQIFGRAGRPQFDSSGEGIIITTHDKLNHYLQLMHNALPIESQFLPALTDHLNAEVVLGTVSNTTEAVAWLTYTYCYVRMLRNPMHYGVPYHELQADPRLHARCRELIEGSVKELAKAKMLRFNFETTNMNTTDTGIVASHFYVKYASLELYNELVHPAMSEADCFEVVAKSSEFENVQARDEENQELVKLLANVCPIKIKCQAIEGEGVVIDQVAKVNILLQAYISKAEVDGFALVADMNHVVQSAGRIFRALFELCVKKGFVTLANKLLTLNKVVTQRLWPHQHALRQFGHLVPADWCFRLEQKNLDVDKLWDMDHKEISGLIRQNNSGLLIQKFVGQFPWLNIQVNVQPITRTILRVTLNIKAQFEWNDRASGSVEPFWVWVEDNENERIYHTEYFLLHKQQMRETHVLAFTVPLFEPLQGQYVVRAISDRWLHAEHAEVINLRDLVLPEKYPPHTTLLKLCPLPKEALQNTQFQSLYKFTHFNAIQTQVFHTLYHTDVNVLLGAPTGSGKTNCCELAMMRLFRTRPKAKFVYVAPMKALVRERMKDWGVRLANVLGKKVVELTGDVSDMGAVDGADVIVTTPEKWDGVSRSWRSRKYVQSVGLVVIDEIHLLGEDRGPVLEVIVSRMRYISAQTASPVRFVGMSTAIANAQDVADWLGAKDGGVFNFHPSVRPVPMQVHIQGYEGQFYCPRMATMNKPTFAAIQDYSKDKPVIVFVSSRRQTRLTALDLIQLGAQSENPRQWVHADDDELGSALAKLKDPNLRHTLSFGIGLHHAGLCEGDRSIVENLFEQCKIQVLVSTSTLAWGVNLPAHLVVIKGTEFYDAPSKRYVDFPITDVLQMMGRAGRPQFDTVGIAVVMVHAPKKAFYKRFLYEPFPVESSLADALHNHLNAEIVSGTIKGKADAVDYLTWTYLFRRLLCNPSYYHLEDTSHEGMSSYLASLVQHTLEDLEDSECIQVTENEIAATTLGRITAYYYLDHTTAHMFASQVEEMVDEKTVLHVLSRATEFAELPVRHNEEHLNSDLAKLVTFGAMGGAMESPHTKTSLLIQAHIGKVPMPIADYNTDLRSVLEQTGRVLQALVDVTADSGYLSAALHAMRLSQAMTQCLFAHQSSLLTLPHANPRVVQQLQQSGVAGLAQLVAMPQSEVARLLRRCGLADANIKTATSILAQLPSVRLAASLVGVEGGKTPFALGSKAGLYEMEAGSEGEVCLRIEQINTSKRGCRAYVPRSPNLPSKARDEGWWAVVGCKETDELLALKRLTIRRNSTSTVLSFLAPEDPGHACLTAYLVSDCYLGLDVESDLPLLLHPASS